MSPEYSLEGVMLKLKLQYVVHLMRRDNLLEKILMLGKIEGQIRSFPSGRVKVNHSCIPPLTDAGCVPAQVGPRCPHRSIKWPTQKCSQPSEVLVGSVKQGPRKGLSPKKEA